VLCRGKTLTEAYERGFNLAACFRQRAAVIDDFIDQWQATLNLGLSLDARACLVFA